MLKRFRRLRISLAAKCRILFGAAITLIITSALYVPWQRMEQLTEQLDRVTAMALANQTLREHTQQQEVAGDQHAAAAVTSPTTQPAATESGEEADAEPQASLIGEDVMRRVALVNAKGRMVPTSFERRSFANFTKRPETPWLFRYYRRSDRTEAFRFAQPLVYTSTCVRCHPWSEFAPQPREPYTAVYGNEQSPIATAVANEPPENAVVGVVSVDMPSRIDANQLLLNRVFIFTAGLLAGTLAVIAFYLITTRLILQPVRVLQDTAEKVSKGDLNIRSDISTGDEFQQLSETFNVMLMNLKRSQDQLRTINKSLDLKLGQLAETNVSLYESNRLKSEFLANVSHELRTPLNSILGFADLLKDNLSASPEGKPARYANNILQSAKHLLDLINDLLDLAKIEAGRMEVRSEPLSLNDVFEALGNILRPLLEKKFLRLSIETAPEVPIIHTDPAKLQQVLYNFLSNAIKFSPPSAAIDLVARRVDAEHVRISVVDRGPGISQENQKLIFEKFRQVDSGVTRAHGGTGLGLAISRELATLLGGTIGVDSAVAQGSTFWIELPLQIAAEEKDIRGRISLA